MIRVIVVASCELNAHDSGEQLGIGAYKCDLLFRGSSPRGRRLFPRGE
jgi:hypothetical protein